MREATRPVAERVSVLDRAPRAADRVAIASRPSLRRHAGELDRVRLALEVRDCMVLIGRDGDDGLRLMFRDRDGGGAVGSMRSALRDYGAILQISSNTRRAYLSGVVADEVTAVRVGDVPAYFGSNAFLADIDPDQRPIVVITTPAGERELGPITP